MAFFSNGSEGEVFREKNCDLCVHDLKKGCPVWLLHLSHNYEQHRDTPEGKQIKGVLDTLIPRAPSGFSRTCPLFHPYTAEEQSEVRSEEARLAGIEKMAPWISDWLNRKKLSAEQPSTPVSDAQQER